LRTAVWTGNTRDTRPKDGLYFGGYKSLLQPGKVRAGLVFGSRPNKKMGQEMPDKPSKSDVIEWDVTEDQPLTPEQRKELRRDVLRYARLLRPGAERN
jgi:hypothetical protein